MTEASEPTLKRRVVRGEGEVTEWPAGLVDYVPKDAPEAIPSPEESRTRNRILLAGRLLGVLRSQGENVDREVAELAAAEQAFAEGDRPQASERVEHLLGELDGRLRRSGAPSIEEGRSTSRGDRRGTSL